MKTFLISIVLLTVNAFAAEVPVFELNANNVSGGRSSITTTYGTNPALGRAWAEIEVTSAFSDTTPDTYRAQV